MVQYFVQSLFKGRKPSRITYSSFVFNGKRSSVSTNSICDLPRWEVKSNFSSLVVVPSSWLRHSIRFFRSFWIEIPTFHFGNFLSDLKVERNEDCWKPSDKKDSLRSLFPDLRGTENRTFSRVRKISAKKVSGPNSSPDGKAIASAKPKSENFQGRRALSHRFSDTPAPKFNKLSRKSFPWSKL